MIKVERIGKHDWQRFSEDAHRIAFSEIKPKDWDRIDFALLVENDGVPMGYVTCREMDAESVYWQYGGAFPGTKNTLWAYHGYLAFIEYCRPKYKRIGTLIENSNDPMLRMAAKVGFKIVGIRNFEGTVLLEHLLNLRRT